MTTYHIDIQHACAQPNPVQDELVLLWAETTLKAVQEAAELTIRFVDSEEMMTLNHTYRNQKKPTNVLAFPANLPPSIMLDCPLLGDVIICPTVLWDESVAANTSLESHWAHIVIHGILHLLGYDHIEAADAVIMEKQEVDILAQLGYDNPYKEDAHFE